MSDSTERDEAFYAMHYGPESGWKVHRLNVCISVPSKLTVDDSLQLIRGILDDAQFDIGVTELAEHDERVRAEERAKWESWLYDTAWPFNWTSPDNPPPTTAEAMGRIWNERDGWRITDDEAADMIAEEGGIGREGGDQVSAGRTFPIEGPGYSPCPEHAGLHADGLLPFDEAFAIAEGCPNCTTWGGGDQ